MSFGGDDVVEGALKDSHCTSLYEGQDNNRNSKSIEQAGSDSGQGDTIRHIFSHAAKPGVTPSRRLSLQDRGELQRNRRLQTAHRRHTPYLMQTGVTLGHIRLLGLVKWKSSGNQEAIMARV